MNAGAKLSEGEKKRSGQVFFHHLSQPMQISSEEKDK